MIHKPDREILPLKIGLKYVEALKRLNGTSSWTLVNYTVESNGLILECFKRSGTSVRDLNGKNYTLQELMNLFINILRALDYVHSKGILMLTINPQSIKVDSSGAVFFTSFTGCRFLDATVDEKISLFDETDLYIAPEVIFEPWRIGYQSDLFSIGLIFKDLIKSQPIQNKMFFYEIIKEMTHVIPERRADCCDRAIQVLLLK